MVEIEPLSYRDRLFLDVESDQNPMQVGACLLFDATPLRNELGEIDFEGIRDFVDDEATRHAFYRKKLASTPIERRPIWLEDADFDVCRHIDFERLPAGVGIAGLKKRCADYTAAPLDPESPLWSILVIDGFDDHRVALLIKAHHCFLDGTASVQLIQSLLGTTPRKEAGRPQPARRKSEPGWGTLLLAELEERRRALGGLAREGLDAARRPFSTLTELTRGAIRFLGAVADQLEHAPPTPLDATPSGKRDLEWFQTDLKRITEIRRRQGGTLNDVVVAAAALALGQYFEDHGLSREEQLSRPIRIALPVDMRDATHRMELGNQVSMMFPRIPVGEKDPLTVLDRTRESLARTKASGLAHELSGVLRLAEWTPRFMIQKATHWAIASHPANLVLTNVHGPRQRLYLLDAALLEVFPVVPLMPGQCLAIAVLSYAGTLYWGFHVDPASFEDLRGWRDCVEQAFESLYSAAVHSG